MITRNAFVDRESKYINGSILSSIDEVLEYFHNQLRNDSYDIYLFHANFNLQLFGEKYLLKPTVHFEDRVKQNKLNVERSPFFSFHPLRRCSRNIQRNAT